MIANAMGETTDMDRLDKALRSCFAKEEMILGSISFSRLTDDSSVHSTARNLWVLDNVQGDSVSRMECGTEWVRRS